MIYYKTLKRLRQKRDLSLYEFADKMGYTVDYIRSLESSEGREKATPEFIAKLRDKLDLHGIPITDEEKAPFYDRLNMLKHQIDYGEYKEAAENIPELTRCAEASCHTGFMNLCDLYIAYYNHATDNIEAFEKIMSSLNQRKQFFDTRHNFFYYFLVGRRALVEERYKDAMEAFNKAEKLDKNNQWCDLSFNYLYGMSLSELDYVTKANEYLRKALHQAKWNKLYKGKSNTRYDAYIEGLLAQNLGVIGKGDEALAILNQRLKKEKVNEVKHLIGYIYLKLGIVHYTMKNFSETIENIEEAMKHLDGNSVQYINCLYHKALALIDSGSIDMGLDILNKGLSLSIEGTKWEVSFNALKHSVMLSNPGAVGYMTDIAIPKLQKQGYREMVLRYYRVLIDFLKKTGNFGHALEYSDLALTIQDEFYDERVRGAL